MGDARIHADFDTRSHDETSKTDTYGSVEFSRPLTSGLSVSSKFAFTQFHQNELELERDRLWSLALEGREGPLRYGARVYSVGEAFDDSLFGAGKLSGLAAASDGHEVWAVLKRGKFTVHPKAQSLTRFQDGRAIDRTRQQVSVARPLPNKARLVWNWRNTVDEPLDSDITRSHRLMSMKYAQPQLQWTLSSIESRTAYTHRAVGNVSRRADVRLSFDEASLLPQPVAVRLQVEDARAMVTEAWSKSVGLFFDTAWERRLTTDDTVRLGATLSYKHGESVGMPLRDGGLGIQLKLELRPG